MMNARRTGVLTFISGIFAIGATALACPQAAEQITNADRIAQSEQPAVVYMMRSANEFHDHERKAERDRERCEICEKLIKRIKNKMNKFKAGEHSELAEHFKHVARMIHHEIFEDEHKSEWKKQRVHKDDHRGKFDHKHAKDKHDAKHDDDDRKRHKARHHDKSDRKHDDYSHDQDKKIKRRLEHLQTAVKHLHKAGMDAPAERLKQVAKKWKQMRHEKQDRRKHAERKQHRKHADPEKHHGARDGRHGEKHGQSELAGKVRQLHAEVAELQSIVRQLAEKIEHLHDRHDRPRRGGLGGDRRGGGLGG